jgi:hypothetical protein
MAAPQKSRHKLDTRNGLVKYDSGYALILQPCWPPQAHPANPFASRSGLSLSFSERAATYLPTLYALSVS